MSKFLTRKKDGRVFPTDSGSAKEYRKTYSDSDNPATPKPTKPTKSHHMRNPSWSAKHTIKGDLKNMYRDDRPENPPDHSEDQRIYKKRLQGAADKEIVHQNKKQVKNQEKLLKKQEKEAVKQAKEDYKQDQQDESEDRELAAKIDGREGDFK